MAGWSSRAPKTQKERRALLARCGPKAFLDPKNLKFPIMAKSGSCKIDCDGVRAAKSRAAQFHRNKVAKLAAKKDATCGLQGLRGPHSNKGRLFYVVSNQRKKYSYIVEVEGTRRRDQRSGETLVRVWNKSSRRWNKGLADLNSIERESFNDVRTASHADLKRYGILLAPGDYLV